MVNCSNNKNNNNNNKINNNNYYNNNMCASCQSSRLFVVRILRGSLIARIKCELAATCSANQARLSACLPICPSTRLSCLSVKT